MIVSHIFGFLMLEQIALHWYQFWESKALCTGYQSLGRSPTTWKRASSSQSWPPGMEGCHQEHSPSKHWMEKPSASAVGVVPHGQWVCPNGQCRAICLPHLCYSGKVLSSPDRQNTSVGQVSLWCTYFKRRQKSILGAETRRYSHTR